MKKHFPDATKRASMFQVLESFHSQTGVFSRLDGDGDARHIWTDEYMKSTAPWTWWNNVAGAAHPEFARFARKISSALVNSSSCERIFSQWSVVYTKLRNSMTLEKQRMALYCYVNWRLLEKSANELYAIGSDSDSE